MSLKRTIPFMSLDLADPETAREGEVPLRRLVWINGACEAGAFETRFKRQGAG